MHNWNLTPVDMNAGKTSYNDRPMVMRLCGVPLEKDQELLQLACEESLALLAGEWEQSRVLKQVFRINPWQRSRTGEKVPIGRPIRRIDEMAAFSRELVDAVYGRGQVEFDGFGWTINPAGTRAREWHHGYTRDYSKTFIPLSPLTESNSLQYLMLPEDISADPECSSRGTTAASLRREAEVREQP